MEEIAGIDVDRFAQLVNDRESVLVLDARPFMSYNTSHVVCSTNVHCPPILKRRSGGFVALENIVPCHEKRQRLVSGFYRTVVAYDQDTEELAAAAKDSNLYSVLKSLKQQVTVPEVYYVIGGFAAVNILCPHLCANCDFSPEPTTPRGLPQLQANCHLLSDNQATNEPVEILAHLYLGGVVHASDRDLLQRLGITALLNVSTTCQNQFEADFRYMTIPVNDTSSADLACWFQSAIDFIDSEKNAGGKVLVHCHAGRSRSATVCLAYLMSTQHLNLDTAYEHIRSRRSVINPNLNFMQQLQAFEKELFREEGLKVPSCMDSSDLPPPPMTPDVDHCLSFASFDFPFPASSPCTPLLPQFS